MRNGSAFRWHGGSEWTFVGAKGAGRRLICSRQAFSLIEVLIVCIILSILAGIGLAGFTYLMETARKKATIAEAREVSTAVTFAHQNTGFFPKLNYLLENFEPFLIGSGDGLATYNATNRDWEVFDGVDYLGRVKQSDPGNYRVYNRRFADTWQGPYWALSPTSKSRMEGPSGYVEMELPERGNAVRRWPMDQYGNPYVLYLLEQTPIDPQNPNKLNVRFLDKPTDEPSRATAVVSYGQDELPGLLLTPGSFAERTRKEAQRLYQEIFPHRRYQMLQESDYDVATPNGRRRLEGYSEVRFQAVPGWTGTADGFGQNQLIGVTDLLYISGKGTLTSDDIIIEF